MICMDGCIAVVCTDGEWPGCEVHPNFGRCAVFHFVKVGKDGIELLKSMPNPFLDSNGAGTSAAGLVAENKATVALAGQFGPKASAALSKWGIRMVQTEGNAAKAAGKLMKE